MTRVRTTTRLLLVDGGVIEAGERFTVVRDWWTTTGERRLVLGTEDGRVVLPAVREELVEEDTEPGPP